MTLFGVLIALIWLCIFRVRSQHRNPPLADIIAVSAVAVILLHGDMWPRIWSVYAEDSFWTLGLGGRIGVLTISAVGLTILFKGLIAKTRWIAKMNIPLAPLWDCVLGLLIFAVVYSISPQVFYTLYQFVFDGLPQQWVIAGLLNWPQVNQAIMIGDTGTLSDDLAGVVFWTIIPVTLGIHVKPL